MPLKDSFIYRKGTHSKLTLLFQLWPLFSSWRWPKSKKITGSEEKLQPLSYPNMSKWSLYLISLFREKYDYFLQYLGYFYQETGRGHKSKEYNQNLTNTILSTRFLVNFLSKNFGSNIFQFCGYRSQWTFQKNFNPDFQIWLVFLVPFLHC